MTDAKGASAPGFQTESAIRQEEAAEANQIAVQIIGEKFIRLTDRDKSVVMATIDAMLRESGDG